MARAGPARSATPALAAVAAAAMLCALAGVAAAACSAYNRTTIGFTNPDGGYWSVSGNWYCDLLPCPGDSISIETVRATGAGGRVRNAC